MKNEFELAFNELVETLKLSRETVIEALEAALVSAYRRDTGASTAQHVEVRLDLATGDATIWVEKEVVDGIQDDRTEVDIKVARVTHPETELNDMVLMESTPENFGRIAAQTAKQVLLQRMREAERMAQYEEYKERVGDLVTGTVQSVTDSAVTVGLGRSEAILPRSQQVPGERYRNHDKVRAFVMEVRESTRGPQIVLSRAHRDMLRRLLEYEVPEIYAGTVEIMNIAREPGARSKVAVMARQEGVDPVGACVGMRGVRIQSIVRELNDEKIDVIEWNPDQAQFIAKALSPARVTEVFLDDDPTGGRTAIVIVPDDQLSLAIGREGQNARLAAKLTGWRIDIKSVTEATSDAMSFVEQGFEDQPEFAEENAELITEITRILEKKQANRPVMPEEYQTLGGFIRKTEGLRLGALKEERAELMALREQAREQIPPGAYEFPLDETRLPLRIYNVIAAAGYQSLGDLMEQIVLDSSRLLDLPSLDAQALETILKVVAEEEIPEPQPEPEPVEEVEAAEEVVVAEAGEAETGTVAEEPVAEAEAEIEAAEAIPDVAEVMPAPEREKVKPAAVPDLEEPVYDLEDTDLEDLDEKAAKEHQKRRRRQLVFDENLGEVVSRRRRKASRSKDEWDDTTEFDEY